MRVEKINWVSKSAKEAELIISDGKEKCLVFSQPCDFTVGNMIEGPLHAVDVGQIVKVIDQDCFEKIIRNSDKSYFSHHCVARIIDLENSLVTVGEFKIELDCQIPSWAEENDLIEFDCARLDIW